MKLGDDPDLIAGEYVLGTLEAGERAAAEEFAAKEPGFAAAVIAWERRFAPLNELIVSVAPPEGMWPRIAEALDQAPQPERARQAAFIARVAEMSRDYGPNVADTLVESRRRWRAAAVACFAVASVFAGLLVNRALKPTPKPAPPPAPVAQPAVERIVGVLREQGEAPAFLLSFDIAERALTVRPVNVPAPAGMRHELWLIPGESDSAVSLGRIAGPTVVRSAALNRLSRDELKRARFAVSVERPEGTAEKPSALVFSGKLEFD
jgi:anti-sigma-K factor RskA